MTQTGSPGPRNDRICITSSCPRQLVVPIDLPAAYADSNSVGSRYLSPRAMIAHAIRAILLAKATAATLVGRRASKAVKPKRKRRTAKTNGWKSVSARRS